jgi:hypothetical protein
MSARTSWVLGLTWILAAGGPAAAERGAAGSSAAEAAARELIPRRLPVKPARTEVGPNHEAGEVYVKLRDELPVRVQDGGLDDGSSGALREARPLLERWSGARWRRLHGLAEERLAELRERAQRGSGRALADPNSEFRLRLPAGVSVEDALRALNALECVEIATPVPRPAPAPTVPDFRPSQGYLEEAPGGVGAREAWIVPGGMGRGFPSVVIDYSINATHAEIWGQGGQPMFPYDLMPDGFDPFGDTNHGTALFGMMNGRPDGEGVTGIAPQTVSFFASAATTSQGYNVAHAITTSLAWLQAGPLAQTGSVMLVAQQIAATPAGTDYVPAEWDLSVYNAIQLATASGVLVVEPAGNGGQDLDDPYFLGAPHAPFAPGNGSGAVIVGAGASPGGSSVDRSRLTFSCYGSRVDLQGWGEDVVTAGYGDLYAAGGQDELYTAAFGGTSAAAAMVAAAAVDVQEAFTTSTGNPLTPRQLRDLLVESGSPQTSGIHPASEHIGPRPDAKAAILELWLYRCDPVAAWVNLTGPPGPTPRRDHAAAFSTAKFAMLVHGGRDLVSPPLSSSYVWRDFLYDWAFWASAQVARAGHAIVFDSLRERYVLVGGEDGNPFGTNETWELDHDTAQWSFVTVAGPSKRSEHALVYDPERERTLLFGGRATLSGAVLGDSWSYDGVGWTAVGGAQPSARAEHAMAYDAERDRIVLFGGRDASGLELGDTWEWNGTNWILRTTSGPPARADAAMVYDSSRGRCVLLGGSSTVGLPDLDVWEWNGTVWTQPTLAGPGPAGRRGHTAAYDPSRGRIIVFGGDLGGSVANDHWELVFETAPATPFCFGDGTGAACPCGNTSVHGSCRGCRNSSGLGGKLRSTGIASILADTVQLQTSDVTAGISLYFQGSAEQGPGGLGTTFGDGLLCVGGTVLRLGSATNLPGGLSSYGFGVGPAISVRGGVTAPGTRTYQVWYRNPAAFCTAATSNVTNGVRVVWGP